MKSRDRPPKYVTEEERKAAHLHAAKKYRTANKEELRNKEVQRRKKMVRILQNHHKIYTSITQEQGQFTVTSILH